MNELLRNTLLAPVGSLPLMLLTLAYGVVESIRIYDARLIQAKTRGFHSGVALEAEGRALPAWVGYIHLAGWALFITILLINWAYGLLLYAALFLLRVLPVLERIGATVMRPFLRSDLDAILERNQAELQRARRDLSEAREEREKAIHLMGPGNTHEDFVPTFRAWWQKPENEDAGLADALEAYVDTFALYDQKYADEPGKVTLARAILNVLESEAIEFDGDDAVGFNMYRDSLRMRVRSQDLRESVRLDAPTLDSERDPSIDGE